MKEDKPELKYYTIPVLIEGRIFDVAVNYQTHIEGSEVIIILKEEAFLELISQFYSGANMVDEAKKDLWISYKYSASNTIRVLDHLNIFKTYYVPLWWFNLCSTVILPFIKKDDKNHD